MTQHNDQDCPNLIHRKLLEMIHDHFEKDFTMNRHEFRELEHMYWCPLLGTPESLSVNPSAVPLTTGVPQPESRSVDLTTQNDSRPQAASGSAGVSWPYSTRGAQWP